MFDSPCGTPSFFNHTYIQLALGVGIPLEGGTLFPSFCSWWFAHHHSFDECWITDTPLFFYTILYLFSIGAWGMESLEGGSLFPSFCSCGGLLHHNSFYECWSGDRWCLEYSMTRYTYFRLQGQVGRNRNVTLGNRFSFCQGKHRDTVVILSSLWFDAWMDS